MADQRISELTELAQGGIATADEFAVVDTDASATKRITWSSLRTDIASYLASLAQTLTNKTIDADNNTISNIVIGAECTGASTALTDTADITYNADTDVSTNGWVVDEDNMISNLATKVPTQQSVKAYVDLKQNILAEGAFVDGDKTKLDGIETAADVTDTANVTSAGALMDSELTDIAAVKALSDADAAAVNTGTSTTAFVTPDALAGSNLGIRYIQAVVFDFTTDTATGDGKFYLHVPAALNGMNLVEVHAEVITAGTTNTTDIQIHNVTGAVDMLSTLLTIDSGETGSDTAATAAVINAANDNVSTNDLLRVDVDAVSTTAAKGLIVTLGFQLP